MPPTTPDCLSVKILQHVNYKAHILPASQISQHAEQLHQSGRLNEAAAAYREAIALEPGDPEMHYNLGSVYLDMGQTEAAVASYLKAQALAPGHPQILLQLGNAYSAQGLPGQAVEAFRQALHLHPGNAAIHFNLGNALRELGQPEQAADSYRMALKLAPSDADSHNNLGNVLRELGRLDEAIASYVVALQLNPGLHHAKAHLVHQKQHICDWRGMESDIQQIRNWVMNVPQAQVSPFAFLAMPSTTAAEQRKCSENWSKIRFSNLINKRFFIKNKLENTNRKLKIGYLSSDFRLHPLAFLVTELIELHDRSRFEVYAYSYALDDKTAERRRLEQAFDYFTDIRPLSLQASAQKINDDGIDILVDLTGFTQTSRSGIAAMRPAPLQVNWLGFPGTMGSVDGTPLFDYILGDAYVTPLEEADNYTEKLAMLPACYQPNDRKRPIGRLPSRKDCGLPDDAFVFCSFNQTFKILPQMFDIWMRLLKAKPGSVLWLLECNQWAKANLCREAEQRGIVADRLIFAPRVPIAEHLARHAWADLFLDTLPYNAHTTASDALWMGLPIVTCSGNTFAGRVAGSLLSAAGLPELITCSLADYERLAMQLASMPDELSAIRNKLRLSRDRMPLFDTPRMVEHLQQAFVTMWEKHAAGQSPQTFSVMLK